MTITRRYETLSSVPCFFPRCPGALMPSLNRGSHAMAFLQVGQINTFYEQSHILFDLSLDVNEGEIVCLLGRNGAGKTTTLRSLMGLTPPRSGSISFRGQELVGLPPYRIAQLGLGYVPEDRRIFPNLTVWENLDVARKSEPDGQQSRWTIARVFALFPQLKTLARQHGGHLSGGEQQMLTIARTLMGNPEVLLLDEPSEGLAPLMVKEVRDVLAEINKAGVSIVLVEHNLKVAMSLADRVYLMGKAHVAFTGTVGELNAKPEIRARYLEV